jgi:putative transcriptional regulator
VSTLKQDQIIDMARSLRQHLNLSQASFAAKLGVSVRTVNRWENGHAQPSKMALKLLEEMLSQMNLEVTKLGSQSSLHH